MTIRRETTHVAVEFGKRLEMLSSAAVGGGLVSSGTIVNILTTSAETARHGAREIASRFLASHGYDREAVCLLTAAPLEHAQFVLREERGIKVCAIVTAGISNALNIADRRPTAHTGEPGSPAADGPAACGTINIIVVTNARLAGDCMVSTVISVTEAKTAALLDLGTRSVYTGRQATGTGTDAVVVVSGYGPHMKFAGGHTTFGQLLGDAAYTGVSRALEKKVHSSPPLEEIGAAFEH